MDVVPYVVRGMGRGLEVRVSHAAWAVLAAGLTCSMGRLAVAVVSCTTLARQAHTVDLSERVERVSAFSNAFGPWGLRLGSWGIYGGAVVPLRFLSLGPTLKKYMVDCKTPTGDREISLNHVQWTRLILKSRGALTSKMTWLSDRRPQGPAKFFSSVSIHGALVIIPSVRKQWDNALITQLP